MANSKAQIFNIVLNTLGVSNPLENADSSDNRAILLNNYYKIARDYVLKDFDWNFASTFRELAIIENADNSSNWEYCYAYPNDCICARDIFEKGSFELQKFEISSLSSGEKVILTNVSNPILRYTRRVENEVYFVSEFTMALSYYLASLTSNVITGSSTKGELAFEKYRKTLKRAKTLNAREGTDYVYREDTYLDSRG